MAKENDSAVAEVEKTGTVTPWGIVADHPKNCDLRIQAIPGMFSLRSAIRADRTVYSLTRKQEMIPADQAAHLGMFPAIPGMELHVNPSKLTFLIKDPLHGDEEMCKKIQRSKTEVDGQKCSEVEGVPPQTGPLDVHRMKTLIREMINLVNAGEARLIKGVMPTIAQCDALPGRYLLNPGAVVQNGQPTYEDAYPAWCDRINQLQ